MACVCVCVDDRDVTSVATVSAFYSSGRGREYWIGGMHSFTRQLSHFAVVKKQGQIMSKLMLPLALPVPDPVSQLNRERALPERLDMPKPVERNRPELPLLRMVDRSFVLTGLADCQWTAQLAKDKRIIQCTTTCLTQMSFTRRTFRLHSGHPRTDASAGKTDSFEDFGSQIDAARYSLVEVSESMLPPSARSTRSDV